MKAHANEVILSRWADGMLEAGAAVRWRKHLEECPRCQVRAGALQRVRATLRGLPPVEANPLEQLQPPVFVPVVRPAFPWWGFAAGLAIGVVVVAAFVVFRPLHLPMRVISSGASETLAPGQPLNNTPLAGDIDLEIPNQVSFRLKPGTTVTWQEMDRLWLFGGRPNIVLNVMKGEVLARTHERFWGSKLQIRTPTANATVKGTAFSVSVDPREEATTLRVLAGSVFMSPYLDPVGIEVRAGREGRVQNGRLARETKSLSMEETGRLLQTYRIGKAPDAAVVVGGGPERLGELLKPAVLHVNIRSDSSVQLFWVVRVQELNRAILEGKLASREKDVRILETAVQEISDPEWAVPLRLFLGACNVRLGTPRRGVLHFQWVLLNAPRHSLASLALAAVAKVTEENLHHPDQARAYFQELLARYPQSPEAPIARDFLRSSAAPVPADRTSD